MIEKIKFYQSEIDQKPKFSILIPSWNNLEFLKLCINSIKKNSHFHHQIVVHINEGSDGTLEWVNEQNLSYSYSNKNVGVCYGFNSPSSLAISEYIVLIDDDVYVCPDWDLFLWEEIEKLDTKYFSISGTKIEPVNTLNKCVISPFDFGKSPEEFKEAELLKQYDKFEFADWNGSKWYPLIIHKDIWNAIGGLSIEFTPGMYSDPDFMMKLWHAGVRYFKGCSKSRSYHFISRTVSRIKKNNGKKQFLIKWGMGSSTFNKYYLRLGTEFTGYLNEPEKTMSLKLSLFKDKLKRIFSS